MSLPKALENVTVIENSEVIPGVRKIVLHAPQISIQAMPGQFVHLKILSGNDPLLRRPFSIAAVNQNDEFLVIYYRVTGRGTEHMTKLGQGDVLNCLGPLGSGFKLVGEKPLLIGGGMGIAPLVFLAERLCPRPSHVVLGGRTKSELFWYDLFKNTCKQVSVATNDGSLGVCGTVINALPNLTDGNIDMIYACGPKSMLKSIAEYAAAAGLPCQVSLEEHMACGLGACLSCTCQTTDGTRKKVCSDGPVFWAEEVVW